VNCHNTIKPTTKMAKTKTKDKEKYYVYTETAENRI
jgi:hypothetical protein